MTEVPVSDPPLLDRRSRHYQSSRLTLHYSEWGRPDAPPLLLLHGFRDHCRSWDWVAAHFQSRFRVIAPDLRGHGNSAWAIGSAYSLDDFLYDIYRLMEELALPSAAIVAHSMGGAIALNFAGTFPARVSRLVAIEGTWQLERPAPDAMNVEKIAKDWIDQFDKLASVKPHKYASVEEAQRRLASENTRLTPAQAHHLTEHGLRPNDDGSLSWKFDPYVRARAPSRFHQGATALLWGKIACPVTLVHGEESPMGDVRKHGLDRHFQNVQIVDVPNAGHWVHHDCLDRFVDLTTVALAD